MNDRSEPDASLVAAIADLQMRLTYQEDDIKQLNLVITHQQGALDALRREVLQLRELLSAALASPTDASPQEPEPPPPHY